VDSQPVHINGSFVIAAQIVGCAGQSDDRTDNSNKLRNVSACPNSLSTMKRDQLEHLEELDKVLWGIAFCFPRPVFFAGFCQLSNTSGRSSDFCTQICRDHFSIGFALGDLLSIGFRIGLIPGVALLVY